MKMYFTLKFQKSFGYKKEFSDKKRLCGDARMVISKI